jgi:hypothetical protein
MSFEKPNSSHETALLKDGEVEPIDEYCHELFFF